MYLFGSLWPRWTLAFKITTPMLHVLFASAQLWGSWCFYKMYKKQERLIAMKEGRLEEPEPEPEPVVKIVEETGDRRLAINPREELWRGGLEMEPGNHLRIL
ncbi:hypothetical protein ACMFMG_007957 [Clarireedia jacksonii]